MSSPKRLDNSVVEVIAETICGSGSGGGGGYSTPGPYRTGGENAPSSLVQVSQREVSRVHGSGLRWNRSRN